MPHSPRSTEALTERWPEFVEELFARLERGKIEYGDVSFERPPLELAGEIEQELLDQAGWAFIAWCRIQELKSKIRKLENVGAG